MKTHWGKKTPVYCEKQTHFVCVPPVVLSSSWAFLSELSLLKFLKKPKPQKTLSDIYSKDDLTSVLHTF